jgi:cell wall-associated NlpC family hydrolase
VIRSPAARLLLLSLIVLLPVADAGAQVIDVRAGRFFDSDDWGTYRIGLTRPLRGILGVQFHGDLLRRVRGSGGMAGAGADLTAFRHGNEGPYLIAGLSGGLGSQTSNDFSDAWGSWSAGAGYDVFPASFLSVGIEGRWRGLSLGKRQGFELGAGLTVHLGGTGGPPRRSPPASPFTDLPQAMDSAVQAEPATLPDSIVATAVEAMGRPYEYGGTGEKGGGFDCSGLIQYAYQKHGISLERRSVDQAREGRRIPRKLGSLRAADLLTFSNGGRRVTHVGLYIGEGRFIHSATRGVQVSTLSADDPYGRWWYKRWIGARRIVR